MQGIIRWKKKEGLDKKDFNLFMRDSASQASPIFWGETARMRVGGFMERKDLQHQAALRNTYPAQLEVKFN